MGGLRAWGLRVSATLLVLDIHVPDAAEVDTGSALIQALIDLAPRYAAYVLGFLAIGTYWINMHRGLRLLRGSTTRPSSSAWCS